MEEYKIGDIAKNEAGEVIELTSLGWQPSYRPAPNFLEKVGRGAMDIAQGAKQGALYLGGSDKDYQDYTAEVDKEVRNYAGGRLAGGDTGFDWGRLTGNVAATLPVGLGSAAASLPAQMLRGAAQGATIGALSYNPGGEMGSKAFQVVAGGLGGGIAPPALWAAGKGVSAGYNATKAVANQLKSALPGISGKVEILLADSGIDFANMPALVRQGLVKAAKEQMKVSGRLDPAALVRKAESEALGFVDDTAATSAQLTRNPVAWARERNLSSTNMGDDLMQRYSNQDAKFSDLGAEAIAKTGGTTKGVGDTNESIFRAINGKWKETQTEVGKIYNDIIAKYGDDAASDLSGVARKLEDNAWDETKAPVIASVRNLLVKHGLLTRAKNEAGEVVYESTGKKIPVKEVESIRKAIGNTFSNNKDLTIKTASRDIIDSIDENVTNDLGDDVFSVARAAASKRFKDFESKIGGTMKKITGETLSEDDAYKSVIRAKSEELQALKDNFLGKNLSSASDDGIQAWNNVRKQALSDIWDKATTTGEFSGATFKKELEKIGEKNLKILFGDESAWLHQIARVGLDMTKRPARSPVNSSNTATTLINMIDDSGLLQKGQGLLQAGGKRAQAEFYLSGSPTNKLIDREKAGRVVQGLLNTTMDKYNKNLPRVSPMGAIGVPAGLIGLELGSDFTHPNGF